MDEGQEQTAISVIKNSTESSERKIPLEKIDEIVERYSKVFTIPERAQERIRESRAFMVSPEEMAERMYLYEEKLKRKRIELKGEQVTNNDEQKIVEGVKTRKINSLKAEIEKLGGVCIPPIDGQGSDVLVKSGAMLDEDQVLGHELLHAAVEEEGGERSGFEGEKRRKRLLNEGAIEVLRLAGYYNVTSIDELIASVENGKIKTTPGYHTPVLIVSGLLKATSSHAEPIGIQKLADYYFSEDPLNETLFEMEVFKKVPESKREAVISLLNSTR